MIIVGLFLTVFTRQDSIVQIKFYPFFSKMNFSDYLRRLFKKILDSIAFAMNHLGFSPNLVTLIALLGNLVAAILISQGWIQIGGFIVLLMGPLDAVDGAIARLRNEVTPLGAFFDSISDRYSELLVLGGLLVYYTRLADWRLCLLTYLAAVGSVMVSYTRARGEGLGFSVKYGLLTRVERYLVMAPSLIFNLPAVGLWVIAVLGNFTAAQRIWQVWRQSSQPGRVKS
jgi:CDP-diacylglycerol---glycerol-3-phosphate 3-phosphatidyltransferase